MCHLNVRYGKFVCMLNVIVIWSEQYGPYVMVFGAFYTAFTHENDIKCNGCNKVVGCDVNSEYLLPSSIFSSVRPRQFSK